MAIQVKWMQGAFGEFLFLLFLISVPSLESWSCALHCSTLELALYTTCLCSNVASMLVDFWLVRAVLLMDTGSAQRPLFHSSPTGERLNWGRDVQCVLPTLIQMFSALHPDASKVQEVFGQTLNWNLLTKAGNGFREKWSTNTKTPFLASGTNFLNCESL